MTPGDSGFIRPSERNKPRALADGLAIVGASSLDRVHDLIRVGTEAGVLYAVQIPLS